MQQEFPVTLGAEDRRVNHLNLTAAYCLNRTGDLVDSRLLHFGIAYDAALADLLSAGFKLRLYQENQV
jgi:hypothetical protein